MRRSSEKRLLQFAVLAALPLPFTAAALGIASGAAWLNHGVAVAPDLDSHFRYLSGMFLLLLLLFVSCVPGIERKGPRFRLLGSLVVAGGLARLVSLLTVGAPSTLHLAGLAVEVGAVPLLLLWQARLARRYQY